MADRIDVIIVGAGPGRRGRRRLLLGAGKSVALTGSEIIGGKCSNRGCIPAKTLLRPAGLEGTCERAAGIGTPGPDFGALPAHRDRMVSSSTAGAARSSESGL